MSLPRHKCSECGLLYFNHSEHLITLPANKDFRERGAKTEALRMAGPGPSCQAGKANFIEEKKLEPCDLDESKKDVNVISKERECDKFIEWIPGLSITDHVVRHRELIDESFKLKARKEFDLAVARELENERREWQKEHEVTMSDRLTSQQVRLQRDKYIWSTVSSIVTAIFAAAITYILSRYFHINKDGNPVP
jgi:hypothetical protein